MRIARKLEVEWRQVLRGSVSTGANKNESSTGRVWTFGFYHVTAHSRLARFETYEPFISLIFNFFLGHGKPRMLKHEGTTLISCHCGGTS
jgi:hypothetical protein